MPPPIRFGTKQVFPETRSPEDLVVPTSGGEFFDSFTDQGASRTTLGALGNLEELRAAGGLEEDGFKNTAFKSLLDVSDFLGITGSGPGEFFDEKGIPTDKISAEQANSDYGIEGELRFTNTVTQEEAFLLNKNKKEEILRRIMADRVKGFGDNFKAFSIEFLREIADPVGFATLFFPSIKIAQSLKLAKALSISRLKAGAIEGAVGTGLALAPAAIVGREFQAEFGPLEGGLNVLFGAAFGAGARVFLGKASDALISRAASKNIVEKAENEATLKLTLEALDELPPTETSGLNPNQEDVNMAATFNEVKDKGDVNSVETLVEFQQETNKVSNLADVNSALNELDALSKKVRGSKSSLESKDSLLADIRKEQDRLETLKKDLTDRKARNARKRKKPESSLDDDGIKITRIKEGKRTDRKKSNSKQRVLSIENLIKEKDEINKLIKKATTSKEKKRLKRKLKLIDKDLQQAEFAAIVETDKNKILSDDELLFNKAVRSQIEQDRPSNNLSEQSIADKEVEFSMEELGLDHTSSLDRKVFRNLTTVLDRDEALKKLTSLLEDKRIRDNSNINKMKAAQEVENSLTARLDNPEGQTSDSFDEAIPDDIDAEIELDTSNISLTQLEQVDSTFDNLINSERQRTEPIKTESERQSADLDKIGKAIDEAPTQKEKDRIMKLLDENLEKNSGSLKGLSDVISCLNKGGSV